MRHPVRNIDYAVWILQGLLPLIASLFLLKKINSLQLHESFVRTLVLLVVLESVLGLIFQFLYMYGSGGHLQLFIISFMIGGEVNMKGYSLTIFAFRYYNSSLEVPECTLGINGS